jgi:hypothetical protein
MSVMFAVMLGLGMIVASSVSTMGSLYLLPSPVLAADEGGSSGGGGSSDNSGSGDNSNGGSNDGEGVKDEDKTGNENTTPSPTDDKNTPPTDTAGKDTDVAAGPCVIEMNSGCNTPAQTTAGGPDGDCLFNPSLPKCKSDNDKCPDGFFQNEDGNCFPQHDKCPKGYHSHENDETGRCTPDSTPCEPGFIRDPDFPTCSQKENVCSKHSELEACGTHLIIIIKKIIHSSRSGNSNSDSSHSLSKDCFDAIKIAWLGKMDRGQNQEVDNYIDKCLGVR